MSEQREWLSNAELAAVRDNPVDPSLRAHLDLALEQLAEIRLTWHLDGISDADEFVKETGLAQYIAAITAAFKTRVEFALDLVQWPDGGSSTLFIKVLFRSTDAVRASAGVVYSVEPEGGHEYADRVSVTVGLSAPSNRVERNAPESPSEAQKEVG